MNYKDVIIEKRIILSFKIYYEIKKEEFLW